MRTSLLAIMLGLAAAVGTAAPPAVHGLDDEMPGAPASGVVTWIAGVDDAGSACPAGVALCMELAGVAVFEVSARVARGGHRLVCRTRCAEPIGGTLMLDDRAGTYRIPHGAFASCPLEVDVDLPDEVGRVRGRGRTRRLVPENRRELAAAMLACGGSVVHVRRLRRRLRADSGAPTLAGTGSLWLDIEGTPRIRVRATSRFVGAPPGVMPPEIPTVEGTGLQACRGTPLRVRCRVE
jgi:hypothetical protein